MLTSGTRKAMCGIVGWVASRRPLSPEEVAAARHGLGRIAHRGPDAVKEWHENGIYLGHRRLSIIDLSSSADQPMFSADGRYVLVYNGEVYNYLELRPELEAAGWRFRTESDSEVLLAAVALWGRKALRRLDGMFAAYVHDRQTGSGLLFRDALGQKPVYYVADALGLRFASEIRALYPMLPAPEIDARAFARFLASSYYALEDTPVAGVRKLLPGCWLAVEGNRIETGRWWDSVPGADLLDISLEEAVFEFERLFDRSCDIAMRSDVPYGVLLSGGVDSSLVLESCHRTDPSVSAFAVSMAEADYDEGDKAKLVMRHLGIDRGRVFALDQDRVVGLMKTFLDKLDEPHGDPGFLNAYFLAQSVRPEIKVALTGDGADELFCGYLPFRGLAPERWLRALPAPAFAVARAALAALPSSDTYAGLNFKARAYLQGFPGNNETRFAWWLATLSSGELARLLPQLLARDRGWLFAPEALLAATVKDATPAQRLLYHYQRTFLPEFVCHHTDRATMQHGLEARAPFLSVPLIEFVNRLPDRLKIQGSQLKVLPKQMLQRRRFPLPIVAQKKQGFTFPIARWLKTSLKAELDAVGREPEGWSGGLADRRFVRRLIEEHVSGRRNNYRILFNLIVFRRWRENHTGFEFGRP
jgi:asparagine synthase (glutamine-hydrolysing)